MQNKTVYFRFYAELNDFLPVVKRQKTFAYIFSLNPSIKDAIEACGVPHSEIEIILINNHSVDFSYRLQDEDRIAVYPEFESLDISPLIRLRAKPLRHPKFILDQNLGKLAKKLRMIGFDASYFQMNDNQSLIRRAIEEKRIILTRSKGLLKNRNISHGYWLRSTEPLIQAKEVFEKLDLRTLSKPFTRCMLCNSKLNTVSKHIVIDIIHAETAINYSDFWQCIDCKNVYWQGSHYQKMLSQIAFIKGD